MASDYQVLNSYPHDRGAFTQGLAFTDGILYEGTGLYGQSTLRRVALTTGEIIEINHLPSRFFGEGITVFADKIIQLTWREKVGFVYDKDTFQILETFEYITEGWGLTHNADQLIMSDGTSTLRFLDPKNYQIVREIQVRDDGTPVRYLNELEYIRGEILANVWLTDRIVRIDPRTGKVIGWINLEGLLDERPLTAPVDVLNGIAYDSKRNRLWVTGKWWPRLFEIEVPGLTDFQVRILEVRINAKNRFQLRFNASPGPRYRLEKASRIQGAPWLPAAEIQAGSTETHAVAVELNLDEGRQFYRIRSLP